MADTPSPARSRASTARICTMIGFVCAVLAVLPLSPLIFGLLGVILGVAGAVLGDKPLGWYAAAAGIVGFIIGAVIWGAALGG